MDTVATGRDTLDDAGDLIALARSVFEGAEAGYYQHAADRCGQLVDLATELGAELRRQDAARYSGLSLLDFEGELERLRHSLPAETEEIIDEIVVENGALVGDEDDDA